VSKSTFVALVAILFSGCAAAESPERVTFESAGVELYGYLSMPEGQGPHPGVVLLHGCGGIYKGGREESPWGKRFVDAGYAVLAPDSFGPRGVKGQCKEDAPIVARNGRERVADAIAAKDYLQSLPDVEDDNIALVGWSAGAQVVLHTVMPRNRERDGDPDFTRAVGFYPGCGWFVKHEWHTRIPLLLLLGGADDWTPAEPCEKVAAKAQDRGEPVTVKVFEDAYHGFDNPKSEVRVVTGLRTRSGSAHQGGNPEAAAEAIEETFEFLGTPPPPEDE
jgi:dienelactone hydrolase